MASTAKNKSYEESIGKLKVGDGQCHLAPSNEKDWQEIHFFPRVS